MSFRTEEKIVLTPSDLQDLEAQLIRRGMKHLHPKRRIHSIYLETQNLAMFRDSEEGVLPRRKVRLRRYDQEDLGSSRLETKISSIEGRFKTTTSPSADETTHIMRYGLFDRQYGQLDPFILVSYDRRYYSLDGTRITFDTDISYARPNGADAVHERLTVCEVKAAFEVPLDNLQRLIDVPRRRFSKFSNGIESVVRQAGKMRGTFAVNNVIR